MKIAALILGLLGALASLGLGGKWVSDYSKYKDTIAKTAEMVQQMGGSAEVDAGMAELNRVKNAGYALLVFGLLSVVGAVMLFKNAKIAAIIFLAAFLVPAVLSTKTILATFFLLIAGILAFLVKPKQGMQMA